MNLNTLGGSDRQLCIHKGRKIEICVACENWKQGTHTRTKWVSARKQETNDAHIHNINSTLANTQKRTVSIYGAASEGTRFIQQVNLENLVCVHSAAYCSGTWTICQYISSLDLHARLLTLAFAQAIRG